MHVFHSLSVCYLVDTFHHIGSDSAWGGFSKGYGIGVWGAVTAGHCSQGQTPTAPLLRRAPHAELIPLSTGLTNFTVTPPAALSRHPLTPRTSPATIISLLHIPPLALPCGVVRILLCRQYFGIIFCLELLSVVHTSVFTPLPLQR